MNSKRNFIKSLAMTAIASFAVGSAFAADITGADRKSTRLNSSH